MTKKKEPEKKTRFIRFRLTEDEWETLRLAAAHDYVDIVVELEKRGLAGRGIDSLANPAEWTRQIALATAEAKLKKHGVKTPREKRREKELV